jgi:hypothetical protein
MIARGLAVGMLILAFLAPQGRADVLTPVAAKPDTFGWRNSVVAGMNFAQSAFSNWTAGGTSSVAWAWSLLGVFEEVDPRFRWRHLGKLEYGVIKQENEDLRKSIDLIEYETLYIQTINYFVEPYASAAIKTQFHTGRDYNADPLVAPDGKLVYPITSDFADPLYLAQSVGVGRTLIPEQLTTRTGFTVRETITNHYRGFAIGQDEKDKGLGFSDCIDNPECSKTKVETGLESVTEFARNLSENAAIASRLGVFYSFVQPDQLDVNWRNDLTIKALKILSVNLGLELLYDKDVLDKLQTKQALGIGVSYSLL